MLPFKLSDTDLDALNIQRKRHNSAIIRDRLWVLWLLHSGFQRQQIIEAVDCGKNFVAQVIKMYNEYGLDGVMSTSYRGPQHPLAAHFEQLRKDLIDACIHTVSEARSWLAQNYNYRASNESVRKLLHRLSLKRRKVNPFPGNPNKIDEWLGQQQNWILHLEDLRQRADNQELDMLFCDAAHFVYGKFDNYLWSDGPRYQPTGHGRHRLNVYGAFDPVTNGVITMYGQDNIDADYVTEYLEWLRDDHYCDRSRPLHVVMDNARYQHCNYVRNFAAELNIVLEFQPGYSPNLNLIERLWKYLKKIMGRSYFSTKTDFHQTLVSLLDNLDHFQHRQKLQSLLTFNFQQYKKSLILGC